MSSKQTCRANDRIYIVSVQVRKSHPLSVDKLKDNPSRYMQTCRHRIWQQMEPFFFSSHKGITFSRLVEPNIRVCDLASTAAFPLPTLIRALVSSTVCPTQGELAGLEDWVNLKAKLPRQWSWGQGRMMRKMLKSLPGRELHAKVPKVQNSLGYSRNRD